MTEQEAVLIMLFFVIKVRYTEYIVKAAQSTIYAEVVFRFATEKYTERI